MAIRGIERMSLAEVEHALQQGACFVFYEYCISVGILTLRRPSDIYFLPPPKDQTLSRFLLFTFLYLLGGLLGLWIYWIFRTRDGHWADETGLKRGVVYSLPSLLLGWWGVPWGLIYTPLTIFTNLSGGQDVTDEVWALLQTSAA